MEALVENAELLVDGLARGFIFALLGIGITVVFGLGGVLNLAIGVFSVIAVLLVLELSGVTGSLWVAIPLALGAMAVFGLALDRSLLSLVYRSEGEERIVLGIFTTLGLAIFLDGFLLTRYPSGYSLEHGFPSVTVADARFTGSSIAVILVSVVVLALLYYLFSRTYLGRATRTVLQDETGAVLCGISPRKMRTVVFVLSVVIAAVAGILYAFGAQVRVPSGFQLTIYALIVSVVGGVRSIVGAVAAGLVLGVVSVFAASWIGAYVAELILFGVAIAVLIARPEQIT